MIRDIAFLEETAKKLPWQEIKMSGIYVCFNPIDVEFYYGEVYIGGSTRACSREKAAELFAAKQNKTVLSKAE